MPPRLAVLPILLVLAVATGCGASRGEIRGSSVPGSGVTVYASVPLTGSEAADGRAVVNGMKLALSETGARAGASTVKLQVLDSAGKDGGPDRDVAALNARTALEDISAVGYVGELDSTGTAISAPILNEGAILQVTPGATYVGLTRPNLPGEPDRFRPIGRPTLGRTVPPSTKDISQDARPGAAELRSPAGRRMARRYRAIFGEAPRPLALQGHEAMAAIIAAIDRAGGKTANRRAVSAAYFGLRRPDAAIGPYRVGASGDPQPLPAS
jgi:ABC-type branched-subunit amino acid transport system substrate-binding protein